MVDLANAGVDVLRLDAVAFTWKRVGTNCQNQPEAHLIAQVYRALLAIAAPAVLLKAEAIVAPGDLLPYLGVHRSRAARVPPGVPQPTDGDAVEQPGHR